MFVQYNANHALSYILLAPRDKDHYSPILDLERTLYTIIEREDFPFNLSYLADAFADYLTPEQRSLFGTLPHDIAPVELEMTPATNHLRTLRRAVTLCDGPLFMRTLDTINSLLRQLKYPPLPSDAFAPPQPNAFRAAVAGWSTTGLPRAVALRIVEETYQRTVGPRTHELNHYQAFSDSVYGELMPSLVSRLLSLSRARPGTLLLDLGSGVGNVVLQAALQSGCSAFGVEVMEKPAEMACEQRAQTMMRARMWGVRMGDVELEHANMLDSARVNELMACADVVLVNNKVFGESCTSSLFCPTSFVWRLTGAGSGDGSERGDSTQVPRLERGRSRHLARAVRCGRREGGDRTQRGRYQRHPGRVRAGLSLNGRLLGVWRREILRAPRRSRRVCQRTRAI